MKFKKLSAFFAYPAILIFALNFSMQAQNNYGGTMLPKKAAPQGMLELPTGSGRILTSRMSGTASARKMMSALHIGVDDYFDSGIILTAAFADDSDQNLQAAFTAKMSGMPVRGIIAIQMHGSSGQATMLFDQWAKFPQTFLRMTQSVNQASAQNGGGGTVSAPVRLTMTALPDGSGQIGLPPGWRITNSYKGTVDVAGTRGEMMGLGGYTLVTSKQNSGFSQGMAAVDFSNPVRAALDYADYQTSQARMRGLPETRVTKVWDTKVIPFGDHPAAFMRFSLILNGQPYEALGLYSIRPIDATQALLYMSVAFAPTEIFKQSLPAMWAAWGSWGIKDEVYRERLTSALQSMRETGDIVAGVNQNRQETYTRVNNAWDQYIGDESTMSDPATGKRYTIWSGQRPADLPPDVKLGDLQPVALGDM